MTENLALPRAPWSGTADDEERTRWRAAAEEAARRLAEDAWERDRANKDPFAEVALLRRLGLVNLLVPAEHGGAGAHWSTAFDVVRTIARADASIAQVLGYHYVNQATIAFYAPAPVHAEWFRRSADGGWVWGDSVNPVDPDLVLEPDGDGFRLRGYKRFSTGSSVGDVIVVNATVRGGPQDGSTLAFVLERTRPGVHLVGDWDFLGQRLSASGSVRYDDVVVTEDDVLGEVGDEPFSTLVTPAIQLVFGNLYLGIAQGALDRARQLVLGRSGSWFLSKEPTYAEDPFVQRTVGELVARTRAVESLARELNDRFDEVVARGADVTAADRAEVAAEIAALKVVSTEVGVEVANRVFEVTGSSSARTGVGLDLFWRNVRTHTLHDPVDYKKLEVGARFLLGVSQPISLYT